MPDQTRTVSPGPSASSVRTAEGRVLHPPEDWMLLPPGDAALTRRVKAVGPSWVVKEKRGRRTFSHGVWAPKARIEAIRGQLLAERSTDAYSKRREADARRRQRKQAEYADEFQQAVLKFLAFAPAYQPLAEKLAEQVAAHAAPLGSGTVARTQRIPIERRRIGDAWPQELKQMRKWLQAEPRAASRRAA